jgi:hypothetical protein
VLDRPAHRTGGDPVSDDPLRDLYERWVCRGRSKKAALAAVARKLLLAINAMMRDPRAGHPVTIEPVCC